MSLRAEGAAVCPTPKNVVASEARQSVPPQRPPHPKMSLRAEGAAIYPAAAAAAAAAAPKNVIAGVSQSCEPKARQPQAPRQSFDSTLLFDIRP